MYEVQAKLKGFKGIVRTLTRTEARAKKLVDNANSAIGSSAVYIKLF